ncbi:MAG: hypothetical protein GY827_07890 [Cytophagales bacterium]|nr:hypothetical protein [Cytophagales bacterium]
MNHRISKEGNTKRNGIIILSFLVVISIITNLSRRGNELREQEVIAQQTAKEYFQTLSVQEGIITSIESSHSTYFVEIVSYEPLKDTMINEYLEVMRNRIFIKTNEVKTRGIREFDKIIKEKETPNIVIKGKGAFNLF